MGKSTPRPPPTPNPQAIINADTQANRVGQVNPFGSATYQSGPGGTNVVTQLGPQMSGLVNRQFDLANTDSQRLGMPQGMGDIGSAIMGRVGQRYGVPSGGGGGGGKPGMAMQPPAPSGMQGGGQAGMGASGANANLGGQPGQLGGQPGGQTPGMGGAGGSPSGLQSATYALGGGWGPQSSGMGAAPGQPGDAGSALSALQSALAARQGAGGGGMQSPNSYADQASAGASPSLGGFGGSNGLGALAGAADPHQNGYARLSPFNAGLVGTGDLSRGRGTMGQSATPPPSGGLQWTPPSDADPTQSGTPWNANSSARTSGGYGGNGFYGQSGATHGNFGGMSDGAYGDMHGAGGRFRSALVDWLMTKRT
jgi:hypothetical protein